MNAQQAYLPVCGPSSPKQRLTYRMIRAALAGAGIRARRGLAECPICRERRLHTHTCDRRGRPDLPICGGGGCPRNAIARALELENYVDGAAQ